MRSRESLECMESVKYDKKKTTIGPARVELTKSDGAFQILVDGNPYYIRGAGLEFGDIPALARNGGNSFRTWRTENGKRSAKAILNEAHEHGLMVCMGLEVGRERHGFDYCDTGQVREQFERIREEVLELKNHPALLMWGIGNELNLKYNNPKVWDAVNEISEMIHEVDPFHLTTTSLAGIFKKEVNLIQERCPDLDLLSFQLYGNLPILPRQVRKFGWEGAYIVSEWGATGHWEVPQTSWGAPIEENSTVKAQKYLERYQDAIAADPAQCVGSYVFLWGQKQERTPTWYGIFLEGGEETECVDVMHRIWKGKWPEHRAPQILSFLLDGRDATGDIILKSKQRYTAEVVVEARNDLGITFEWEVLYESEDLKDGGDWEERPETLEDAVVEVGQNSAVLEIQEQGSYRLFVFAKDTNKKAATANIPFRVIPDQDT